MTSPLLPIINRNAEGKFELPADGWFHLVPLGEYPVTVGAERLVQIVDDEAIAAMVNRFAAESAAPNFAGKLIDFDHFSYDPEKSSEAAGWIDQVENRADGLWGHARLSDVGESALLGGRFRLISPVWWPADCQPIGNGRVRPLRLDSAGLTNNPNMRGMVPLSNRQEEPARSEAGDKARPQTNRTMLKLETIAALLAALSLPAEATDEQVMAALPGAVENKNKAGEYDAMKNRADTLAGLLAERDLDSVGITDPAARTASKPLLIANRDGALALLKLKPAPAEARAPLTNRGTAQQPTTTAEAAKDEKRGAIIANRARTLRSQTPSMPLAEAYRLAEQELNDTEAAG